MFIFTRKTEAVCARGATVLEPLDVSRYNSPLVCVRATGFTRSPVEPADQGRREIKGTWVAS